MEITGAAIRRSRVTGVLIAVLVLGGAITFFDMPRQTDPGFIIRIAQVLTFFPGASPERVEQLVTAPIEEVVQEIPQVDAIISESRTGLSMVFVTIREDETNMRPIWDNLRRKIDRVRDQLPDGLIGPNVNDEFGDTYGIILTVIGDGVSAAELAEIADEIRESLLRIDDVAKVDVLGAQEERIFVEYENARLARLGLSSMALQSILQSRNIIMPGGTVSVGDERIVLEPTGNFVSLDELRRTVIQIPGTPNVTYLGDIAEVTRGYVDPPESVIHSDGNRGLALAISMREGGNLIQLGRRVQALYAALPSQYPYGVEFQTAFFEPTEVQGKVNEFTSNVLQSIGIVLLVMLLTLGLRTGAIVATLIPTTMVISLLIMSVFEIYIDQVSLASLIIALGLLVDNAIVMSESIMVRMGEGESAFEASVNSAKELQSPLLISSLTTAAAFLPIFLAESSVGEYTAPLFKVVMITLLVSWGLALTMTPLFCVHFIRPRKQEQDPFERPLFRFYRRLLQIALRWRWVSVAVVIAIFAASMSLFALVPQLFFPVQERSFFLADLTLAPGTSIERTEEMATGVDGLIRSELAVNDERAEGIVSWTSFIGASPPRFVLPYNPTVSEPHKAILMVNSTSDGINDDLMRRIEAFAIDNFPEVETYIRRLGNGPPVFKPIEIRISGRNVDRIFEIADEVKERLGGVAGVRNVTDDWGLRVKKLIVHIDEELARRAGITNLDVALSLQTFLSGLTVTDFREEDDIIPVLLRSVATDRQDVDRIETLNVFSQSRGHSVPLHQIARIELTFQPNTIRRRDLNRTVTVGAELAPGVTAASVIDEVTPWLDEQQSEWERGYRYSLGGEMESSVKANRSIEAKLPIAGLIIILLLVWQFNSLRKPLIVLTTIPLALIGVVVGLLAMDSYFGFMTLLGVVSLAGIVVNNAIVLIERIDIEQNEYGHSPPRAIIEAAQRRMRPILLTTATTIASLIPLYLGGGVMWEPMAVAIMFGLLFSTALTLGFVPLFYSLLYRVSFAGFDYDQDRGVRASRPPPRSSGICS